MNKKSNIIVLCIGIVFLLAANFVQAQGQQLVERVIETTTTEKNPTVARKNLVDQATDEISRQLIVEMIGEAKFNRNRSVIQTKIIRNSARFLPFLKNGNLETLPEAGHKMTTVVRVNLDALQSMLLENGLMYETDGTPSVLPVIKFVDRVNGRSFMWWTAQQSNDAHVLTNLAKTFEESLRSEFRKDFFYVFKPIDMKWKESIPTGLQTEYIRFDDLQWAAEQWGAQILVQGEFSVARHRERTEAFLLSFRLTAVQSSNGRVVAEVVREFESDRGTMEAQVVRRFNAVASSVASDLSKQILDAWQKGAIGASLYRITIRGRVPIQQQEAVKELFRNRIREIKSIRERSISVQDLVFEVDSGIGPVEIGKRLPQLEFASGKLVLQSTNEAEAIYRIEK